MLLRNVSSGRIVATRVEPLTGFFRRTVGLLGRRALEPDEGVWLAPCNAIHTVGMRVTIDVVFLDRSGRVVRVAPGVAPQCPALICRGAGAVVELGSGALHGDVVRLGDELRLD